MPDPLRRRLHVSLFASMLALPGVIDQLEQEIISFNKLLFEVRHSADLRARILTILEAVAAEYELQPAQRKAAEELINVGKGGLVSEHVRPLVEAGAHPLQALMSLHVIFSMSHQRGQQPAVAQQAKN